MEQPLFYCKWIVTISSNLCELRVALEGDIGARITMSGHCNCTKFCCVCIINKSHTNQSVVIQQQLIVTICVNRFR